MKSDTALAAIILLTFAVLTLGALHIFNTAPEGSIGNPGFDSAVLQMPHLEEGEYSILYGDGSYEIIKPKKDCREELRS